MIQKPWGGRSWVGDPRVHRVRRLQQEPMPKPEVGWSQVLSATLLLATYCNHTFPYMKHKEEFLKATLGDTERTFTTALRKWMDISDNQRLGDRSLPRSWISNGDANTVGKPWGHIMCIWNVLVYRVTRRWMMFLCFHFDQLEWHFGIAG